MRVTLIGKKSLYKVDLPKIPIGNYWLTDKTTEKERKLLNIEGKDGYWKIRTNENVNVINPKALDITEDRISLKKNINEYSDSLILQEHCMYAIKLGNMNDIYILYCSPVYDNNIERLSIKKEFYIGKSSMCPITYDNVLTSNAHAKIFRMSGRWVLENLDRKIGTFVNGEKVGEEERILQNGDVIYIVGLKIIMLENSIFINNPLNKVSYNKEYFQKIIQTQKVNVQDYKTNDYYDEIDLYNDNDYFSRAPRIINLIEEEKVKIDAPPQIQDQEDMPMFLTLGSSLSMGLMMMISIAMTIDGRVNGTATAKETTFSMLMALTMLVSMIMFPVLIQKWEKKRKIKYEQKRQTKYKEYLYKKSRIIEQIKEKQKKILFQNYGSVEDCVKIIIEKNSHLWERKIESYDFLHIRLGIGDVPLKINLQVPEEQFSMEDDNLMEILNKIVSNSKVIKSAPIITSLVEKNISALIIRNDEVFKKMMQNIIIQLIALHSYEDLKLVFLIKKENEQYWEYVKMLPHVWNNSKDIRFFADNPNDMREISNYLEQILKNRQVYDNNDNVDYKSFSPYYLIITDDYDRIKNLMIIRNVLECRKNLGFSLLCITRDLTQLPNECKSFVSLEEKKGIIFDNQGVDNNQREIEIDMSYTIFSDKIVQTISNIPIKYSNSGSMLLPNTYTFLEMYDVGLIEQLNILDRWKKNDSTISLKAPIGIDSSGMPIVLDIHEKAHGPHGLIAGSTGSGKSEFIITYILSLAVNYHPNDVSFLLIDYKGGGLAGAFQKNDIKLPHLVGKITNIDTNGLQRSLASIQSELKRRQVIFDKARNMIDDGVIDIYKYQKLYHEGVLKIPVPHLLIICDEFAELKQQQEEFMDGLISVSRIGRSLGVHLILATQKPAGIVNDQIRSNSKFAICLKVQDREDSNDVIKRPDAASLRRAGQFFMQVGNNDYFVLGQSAWAGAQYYPSSIIKKKIDNSINFVSNIGISLKDVDNINQKSVKNRGEQLTNIVRYMSELAKTERIKTANLWLEEIPEKIYIDKLKKKYQVKKEDEGKISCVIGEYDDPYNQKQGIVKLDFTSDGNTIIYGNTESGKETLLSTVTYDLMQTYSSEDVWIYILDFGSEALKIFKDSPHVGDVVFIGENEKLGRFFDMIQRTIKERKNILSNYNGNYNLYVKTAKEKMPMIIVILNNYEAFSENYENQFDDIFLSITRECVKCGIVFAITANAFNDLRYRLSQNFRKKIALQINNEDDYFNIFDKVGKKRPSHIFGRGLISLDNDEVFEFQTARICDGSDYNVKVKEKIQEINDINKVQALTIPVMPDKITLEDIRDYIKGIDNVPIGLNQKDLRIFEYDFKKNFITIMTSKNIDDVVEFTEFILEIFKKMEFLNIIIFDAEKNLMPKKEDLKERFEKLVLMTNNNVINMVNPFSICIINGLDKFLAEIEDDEYFYKMLRTAEDSGKYSFIIIDSINKLKNHEYDTWYKNYISGDNGIYVGNGIDDQFAIAISDRKEIINNCGRSFGYVIKNGNPILIKLVGLKEIGDENE